MLILLFAYCEWLVRCVSRWILLGHTSSVAWRSFAENFVSLLLAYYFLFVLKVKVNEAEEKYKTIQEKLVTINEEAETLQPRCILLKADVQARRKAVNEAEVGKATFNVDTDLKP